MSYDPTIQIRAVGIATRPLPIILQPTHPCARYLWIQKPPYISPSFAGPASTLATQGKMGKRPHFRTRQTGV
jgi:hypothetical protein